MPAAAIHGARLRCSAGVAADGRPDGSTGLAQSARSVQASRPDTPLSSGLSAGLGPEPHCFRHERTFTQQADRRRKDALDRKGEAVT